MDNLLIERLWNGVTGEGNYSRFLASSPRIEYKDDSNLRRNISLSISRNKPPRLRRMELREFIKTALVDIVGGVCDAAQEFPSHVIVPKLLDAGNYSLQAMESGLTPFQTVSFEIAVTAEEGTASKGKLKVGVSVLGAGIDGESHDKKGHSSTISFKVPIFLPQADTSAPLLKH